MSIRSDFLLRFTGGPENCHYAMSGLVITIKFRYILKMRNGGVDQTNVRAVSGNLGMTSVQLEDTQDSFFKPQIVMCVGSQDRKHGEIRKLRKNIWSNINTLALMGFIKKI